MTCNKYVPSMKNSFLLLAGGGDSVLLKQVAVKYVRRVERGPKEVRKAACCSVF